MDYIVYINHQSYFYLIEIAHQTLSYQIESVNIYILPFSLSSKLTF